MEKNSTLFINNEIDVSPVFSIVMACYNVESYIEEAISSIINQTFDFNHVEIILVDDGSTDDTAEICKKFTDYYPNNIKYFFKENGGQASARNFGLKHVCGKYVNFLDADDKFMVCTLEKVFDFFEQHYSEIDLVSVPMYFFERKTGDHPLNYKFKESKVIDLHSQWNYPQLATNSAFFKREVFENFKFDTSLISSEDAIMVNKLLLNKYAYGVVSEGGLCYRKRFDESSTIDVSKSDNDFYNGRLKGFFIELIKYSNKKLGYVPKFIQYVLIYDIKWMLISDEISDVLNEEELKEFYHNVRYVLNHIDDEVIDSHLKKDVWEVKKHIYELKYTPHEIKCIDDEVIMYVRDHIIDELSIHKLYLDIVEIKKNHLFISGFFKSFFSNDEVIIKVIKKFNNHSEAFDCKTFNYFNRKESEFFKSSINFDFDIPLNIDENCEISIMIEYSGADNHEFELPISFLNHARLSEVSNYSVWGDYIIHFKNNKFFISKFSFFKMFKWEVRILLVILKNMPSYWTSAIFFRVIYLILFPFYNNKKIWIFMDRRDTADDNAEHLYKYCKDFDDGIKKYFTLCKDSKDFNRLNSSLSNIVPFYSFKQRVLYLFADKIISSHPDEFILNPFWGKNSKLYSGLINSEKVFLQHGITKDNISLWLRKYDKNLAMLVTVSEREAQSFLDYEYNYDESVIKVVGFPRFDNLVNNSDKKQILIMPTWRRSVDHLKYEQIIKSEFFQKLNELFNNERLIKLAKDNDYTILIKLHPKIMDFADLFDANEYVYVDKTSNYQYLFNNSSLLITDYSSVAFDFAYIKKPVLYYQYSDDYHFEETFFDYEKMGFGEVIDNIDELIDVIEDYLSNNCEMKEKYKNRVDSFFKFKDKNNCKRVYDAIIDL